MVIERNEQVEKVLREWLSGIDISSLAPIQLSYVVGAMAELSKATQDLVYDNFVVKAGNMLKTRLYNNEFEQGNLANMKLANTFYYIGKKMGDDSFIEAAKKAAEMLNTQPRNEDGIFVNQGSDACQKDVCICQAYLSQIFYMNYESNNGGKERYNDIIAQYNAYREKYYDKPASDMKNQASDGKLVALYAASLIDTMEVVEQPMYEIFRRMQGLYKEAVLDMVAADVYKKDNMAALMGAYAVLKGCRMKALITEKYEEYALNVLSLAADKLELNETKSDISWMSAYACAYSESLKNREYQDYGRGKGGALWS